MREAISRNGVRIATEGVGPKTGRSGEGDPTHADKMQQPRIDVAFAQQVMGAVCWSMVCRRKRFRLKLDLLESTSIPDRSFCRRMVVTRGGQRVDALEVQRMQAAGRLPRVRLAV